MATPHVSGVAALVKSLNQSRSATQIKNIILSTTERKSSLHGLVNTSGRLDAYQALTIVPPVADYTGFPVTGIAPLNVAFTDLSKNFPSSWNWSFGDGSLDSSSPNPEHTYVLGGSYTVSLMVTNAAGSDSETKIHFINVTNATTEIGVVRNSNMWILDASGNGAFGPGDFQYTYGKAGDVYVTGDWNTDGKTEIGVVRNGNMWILDASGNGAFGPGDLQYTYGKAGDMYVTGDWNADGKTGIGVVRNGNMWILDASGNGAFGPG
jgi:hypothetical protein